MSEGKSLSNLGLSPRRRSPKSRSRSVEALQRFVRVEQWNGLVARDVVKVAGHGQRGRHWRFRAHVTNTSNGASWVELALVEGSAPTKRPSDAPATENGGGDGERSLRVEKIRSFDPDLVEARWSRLGRRRPRGKHMAANAVQPASEPTADASPEPPLAARRSPSFRVLGPTADGADSANGEGEAQLTPKPKQAALF